MNTLVGFPNRNWPARIPNFGPEVWVGAQIDPLVVFAGVASELG